MVNIIMKNSHGIGRYARACMVLLLTLFATMFIGQGWFYPIAVQAAPVETQTWSNVYSGTAAPGTLSYSVPSGSNRMLVVAVSTHLTALAAQTCSVTYGGQAMTAASGNSVGFGVSTQTHAGLFYLPEAGLRAASSSNLVVTLATGTVRIAQVHAAVYTNVNQSATPITNSQGVNVTTAGTAATLPALNIASGDTAVAILNLSRTASTTPRTVTAWGNWTSKLGPVTQANTDSMNSYSAIDSVVGNTTSAFTASGTTLWSIVGMSIKESTMTIGTVTVTPSSGTYTGSAPTISAPITSTTTLSTCEYTTNGSTWAGGTISGTLPNYTCTANASALSGALTINIRGTNTGGTVAGASPVSLSVDSTNPTDPGALSVYPGYTMNSLLWTAATDSGGAGFKQYDVRFSTTATPANCTSGTSAYAGKLTNYDHSGLATSQIYYYRVCAVDNVNNTSTGLTASATTITRNSAINSCGKCHVYPNTANPPADSPTTRGTPAGSFKGSHAEHAGTAAGQYAYVCSKCHIAPTYNNLAHATRTINMANPMNGDTGGKYGKGTSWPYTDTPTAGANCSLIYCHSNGTSVATTVILGNISSPKWGNVISTCNKCHGTSTRTAGAPWYPNYRSYSAALPTNAGWTNPGYALKEDGATATYTAATAQPLVFTSFDIAKSALQAGKTITGISVSVKGRSATSRTLNVSMTKTGNTTVAGTAKTVALTSTNAWHVVNTAVNDLWGTTWATTDILGAANTTFGVIVKDNAATASDIAIDAVKVTVHTADGPKFNSHSAHIAKSYGCNICHYSTTTNGTSVTGTTVHAAGTYSVVAGSGASFTFSNTQLTEPSCSSVSCHGNAVWGVSKFDCVSCHSVSITRTVGLAAGLTLGAVSTEFGLTYGHKKSTRGTVTANDCIVCHLEGNGTTKKPSTYHQNGTIDLRAPQGTGEEIIKDFSGTNFAFRRFSTPATRTSAKNNADIAQVVSLQFCMMCHKREGATNTTARSGAGTALSPWGASTGYALNLNIGVPVLNGTINVFSQFSSNNSSVHPVKGPRVKDFPTPARLNAPYNAFTRAGTAGTKTAGIMINCFDCHNTVAGLKYRTVAAHGSSGTSMVAGTFYASGPTLCLKCHTGYTSDTQHLAGSAMQFDGNGGEGMATVCQRCHGSADTLPARPIPAADYHGYNTRVDGTNWPTGGGKAYAFIRNVTNFAGTGYHRPQRGIGELTTGSATCNGGSGCAGNGSARTYTPGGQY